MSSPFSWLGPFCSVFFFLLTEMFLPLKSLFPIVRSSLNVIHVEYSFNMEKFLMLMKIISHLKILSEVSD